jgi:hypothetical protein
MAHILDDKGTLQVVLQDYEQHKLPRMLAIKEQVDKGELLNDIDLNFLKDMYREIHQYEAFIEEHKEYRVLYKDFVQLYCAIMDTALINERQKD